MKIFKQKLDSEKLKSLKIDKWPIWTCDIKKFDWHYDDFESCYFIEGKVKVKTDFEEIEINKGDLVVFPKGLDCVWNVIEPVKKYYSFEDITSKL